MESQLLLVAGGLLGGGLLLGGLFAGGLLLPELPPPPPPQALINKIQLVKAKIFTVVCKVVIGGSGLV